MPLFLCQHERTRTCVCVCLRYGTVPKSAKVPYPTLDSPYLQHLVLARRAIRIPLGANALPAFSPRTSDFRDSSGPAGSAEAQMP